MGFFQWLFKPLKRKKEVTVEIELHPEDVDVERQLHIQQAKDKAKRCACRLGELYKVHRHIPEKNLLMRKAYRSTLDSLGYEMPDDVAGCTKLLQTLEVKK